MSLSLQVLGTFASGQRQGAGGTGIGRLAEVGPVDTPTTKLGWVRLPGQAGHADAAGAGEDDGKGGCGVAIRSNLRVRLYFTTTRSFFSIQDPEN